MVLRGRPRRTPSGGATRSASQRPAPRGRGRGAPACRLRGARHRVRPLAGGLLAAGTADRTHLGSASLAGRRPGPRRPALRRGLRRSLAREHRARSRGARPRVGAGPGRRRARSSAPSRSPVLTVLVPAMTVQYWPTRSRTPSGYGRPTGDRRTGCPDRRISTLVRADYPAVRSGPAEPRRRPMRVAPACSLPHRARPGSAPPWPWPPVATRPARVSIPVPGRPSASTPRSGLTRRRCWPRPGRTRSCSPCLEDGTVRLHLSAGGAPFEAGVPLETGLESLRRWAHVVALPAGGWFAIGSGHLGRSTATRSSSTTPSDSAAPTDWPGSGSRSPASPSRPTSTTSRSSTGGSSWRAVTARPPTRRWAASRPGVDQRRRHVVHRGDAAQGVTRARVSERVERRSPRREREPVAGSGPGRPHGGRVVHR